ncbi:MMPL family transporter [Pontibacillus yanchengensis]|uniref:MMPL family transporter n=2 Tax=Pontibacillus yanchengensis TaxID=462910 RepID=A0A6I4ZTT4_9BACI|nr:MMPL family transporter [Pontibacillus yanchengensis]MYL33598.1 MMPL family transporter [Pontibacillus yanchengensis]MYL54110.1 MMPL family transporter [Pontibacillus yanchengensis]
MENRSTRSTKKTVTMMAPAILTALLATAVGFLALYTSPVPMIQDFGKMLTIGMVVSFIVGLFILIPILFTRDHFFIKSIKKNGKAKCEHSKVEKLFGILTNLIIKLKWLIIFTAIVTATAGIWGDLNTGVETDVETFMPQDTQELEDIHRLRDILGTTDQVSIMYSTDNVLDEETLGWTEELTASLPQDFPSVVVDTNSLSALLKQANEGEMPDQEETADILSDMPEEQLKLFVNKDRDSAILNVGIEHLEAEELQNFITEMKAYISQDRPEDIDAIVTGKSVLDVEMVTALTTGRYKMTLLGMGLVFMVLLLIYRHPVKAFIPLLPILFIVGWSGGIMYLFGINYTPLTATLGALIIGIGTEFTILIMERFYEERRKGSERQEAIMIANQKIGKAIFASAFTTIGGFSALLVSDFVILSNFGMMTLVNISFALISTIIVLPAILILLDRFVQLKGGEESGSDTVMG